MTRVIVLGASGMLGSMVTDVLSRDPNFTLSATVRSESLLEPARERLPGVDWRIFAVGGASPHSDVEVMKGHDWAINCIGITKPHIRDNDPVAVERAIQINAVLPYEIAMQAAKMDARMIQIATDCVYSGVKGAYRENDPHDALDIYGKTKSLGEVERSGVYHLRCSIIGPEPKEYKFLLEWFRRQPYGARIKGYVNHLWNGLTTLHFGKIARGIIRANLDLPSRQHVVPTGVVAKDEMLRQFAKCYDREDVAIESVKAENTIDRTLITDRPEINHMLWKAAGYDRPPSILEMLDETSKYDYKMTELG